MHLGKSKKILVLFAAAGLFIALGFAQQAPKIAAVDLQRTFEQSVEGKSVLSQLRMKEQSIIGGLLRAWPGHHERYHQAVRRL